MIIEDYTSQYIENYNNSIGESSTKGFFLIE